MFSVMAVSCGNNADSYDATGTFEADEITVSAEVSGRMLDFTADEGRGVAAGDVVGQIDTVQLYLKKLQLEENIRALRGSLPDVDSQTAVLKEQLKKQKTEEARVRNLAGDGVATGKQLDDVVSATRVLESQLNALESQLKNTVAGIQGQISSAQVQILQIEDNLGKCRITAPAEGTVLTKYIRKGEFAAAGRPLFRMADTGRMYLRAYFSLGQLKDVKIGQEVKVTADFGGGNVREYAGTVCWISDKSEFTPKSIQTKDERENLVYAVKISIQNDGYVKIGMYGEVIL